MTRTAWGGIAAVALGLVGGVAWWATRAPVAPPEAPAPEAPAPSASAAAPAAEPAPVVWTVDNIQDLKPVAPARKSAVPRPIPPLPAYDVALQVLSNVVETYAGDPENPWAIGHGILARGTEFRLTDGREAIPHLFAAYAEPRTAGTLTLVGFPKSRGKIRVEPHTDLLLKNMGEAGVSPDATFATPAGTVPIADLYRYTVLKSYLVADKNKSSFDGPNDLPWGLQAIAQWAPTSEMQWIALDGTPMDLDYLTSFVLAVVTQESAFMFDAMNKGKAFDRQGQGIFNYTCGGAHLVQGATYAVARGFGTERDRKVLEAHVPLLFYRLPIELGIYDEAMKRNPKFRTQLLVQRMKFLGHWLESVAKMEAMGIFTPDEDQQRKIEGAAQNLTLAVDALQKTGAFDDLPGLRKKNEQLYLDIVGDGSHAIRGLELALGRGTIAW